MALRSMPATEVGARDPDLVENSGHSNGVSVRGRRGVKAPPWLGLETSSGHSEFVIHPYSALLLARPVHGQSSPERQTQLEDAPWALQ